MSCLMAKYVLIIKKFCKYYLFNLIILDIKQKLIIAIYKDFEILMTLKNYQRVLNKLTVSIEQIDREF